MASEVMNLVASLEAVRVNKDLEIVKKGLEENVQEEKNDKDNFFKKLGKNMSNSVRKSRTESLEKNQKADEDGLENLKKNYSLLDEEALKKALENYKDVDSKAVLGILYLLFDTNEYKDSDETLKSVSMLLYGDAEKISSVKKDLNSHFNKIAGGLFASLKASPALLLSLEGYLLTLNKDTKDKCGFCLANEAFASLEGKEEDKKQAKGMTALILMGKNGVPYCMDEEKGNTAFFDLAKENIQSALSVNAYLLALKKPELKDEDLKNDVKVILTSLSKLSLACEVNMIIEKEDQENAKDKLSSINSYISDLAEILK